MISNFVSGWRVRFLEVGFGRLPKHPNPKGDTVKKIAFFGALAALAAAVACSSSTTRSGFEDPNAASGDSGAPPPIQATDAGAAPSCVTAKAAAIKPPVDLIVVVDQSGSMSDEIASVKSNINNLSTILSKVGIDYRVVMIGTVGNGTYDLCVPPPLGGPGCASNGSIYRTVDRNVQSNDALSIILETIDKTSGPMLWRDFLRPDAQKIFIPVTDDNSTLGAVQFDAQIIGKGPFGNDAKRNYVFYPIAGANAFPAETKCTSAVNNGSVYLELAKMTGGKWFPVCDTSSFASVFSEIGKSVAASVACELSIPTPANGDEIDPTRVNVKLTGPDGKTTTEVLQDTSAGCDAGANGWQYSADGTKVLLCGDACNSVREETGTKVDIEFGCQTKVK